MYYTYLNDSITTKGIYMYRYIYIFIKFEMN